MIQSYAGPSGGQMITQDSLCEFLAAQDTSSHYSKFTHAPHACCFPFQYAEHRTAFYFGGVTSERPSPSAGLLMQVSLASTLDPHFTHAEEKESTIGRVKERCL